METAKTAFRNSVIATTACAIMASTPLLADEKKSNRTLRAGPDVWRIELHDADQLRLGFTGDTLDAGEIRWISWRLISGDQYHQSKIKGKELQPVGQGGRHKGSYVKTKTGETVSARIPEGLNGRQLWVHAQEYDRGGPKAVISFALEIKARDLDCTRKRVCRRGDTDFTRISVELDVPPVRSRSCVPANTLRLGYKRDDSGEYRASMHPEGRPTALSQEANRAPQPEWGGILERANSGRNRGLLSGLGPYFNPYLGSLEDVAICIVPTT